MLSFNERVKMTKRKFRKLKGVSKVNDEHSQKNDRRPFVFSITTSDGGLIESQGNIRPEDTGEMVEILNQAMKLHRKGQPD